MSVESRTDVPNRPLDGQRADGGDNIVDLIGRLTQQSGHLAQEQLNLVQAEMREGVADLKLAAGALTGAAVVGIAGLGVTLMGLAYLLGYLIENVGLATLIVGIVTLLAAFFLYNGAKRKIAATNLSPDRSIRTVEDTPEAISGNLNHSGDHHA